MTSLIARLIPSTTVGPQRPCVLAIDEASDEVACGWWLSAYPCWVIGCHHYAANLFLFFFFLKRLCKWNDLVFLYQLTLIYTMEIVKRWYNDSRIIYIGLEKRENSVERKGRNLELKSISQIGAIRWVLRSESFKIGSKSLSHHPILNPKSLLFASGSR